MDLGETTVGTRRTMASLAMLSAVLSVFRSKRVETGGQHRLDRPARRAVKFLAFSQVVENTPGRE